VTVLGAEAIPLAITTSVLLPVGVDFGIVNWVEELMPGATDAELQSCVVTVGSSMIQSRELLPSQVLVLPRLRSLSWLLCG
jgi:hypothetical protein